MGVRSRMLSYPPSVITEQEDEMKKRVKKLELAKETVRSLGAADLAVVAAGSDRICDWEPLGPPVVWPTTV